MLTLIAPDPDAPEVEATPDDPAFATLVATDGTLIRLRAPRSGELVIEIGGRAPKTIDRFQVAALRVAMLAVGER